MVSDETLLGRIKKGEVTAFDLLYARYATPLLSFLVKHVGDRGAAEDILQEVFMTLLKKAPERSNGGSLKAWLYTVARNRGTSYLRAAGRRATRQLSPQQGASAPRLSPEHVVAHRMELAELQGALDALPDFQREVVLLKQVAGLTYVEIAQIQGVPEGTVKSRLHLALRALRQTMAESKENELCAVKSLRAP